jgi:dienelactone hydrolase
MMTHTMIGAYGPWFADRLPDPPALSLRRGAFTDVVAWKEAARTRLLERLAMPDLGSTPSVTVTQTCYYDGLDIEHLSWQLPYGPSTQALLLKPAGASGPLPGILALHDHAGNKYFGLRKITRAGDQHPLMADHQHDYYGGRAWANEIAKQGYVVLVPDAFPFGSRRVRLADVPAELCGALADPQDHDIAGIAVYNAWAANHESVMSKSLLCGGTTWPGVYLAEDRMALDILCARPEVNPERVGCGGLSGGGMRTVFLGGADERIRCAVCVGLMTTWRDCLLNKSYTHTWMLYVPLLPNELDFPEILGLRVPLPTMVLNNRQDRLFTLSEMERADETLAQVYAKAEAPERYRCHFYDGPHKFDLEMQADAFAWFDRWLKE